jgi:hypothetical protein
MRVTLLATSVLVMCVAAPASAQKQITLIATIADASGNKIDALDAKDVRVTEDGTPLTITKTEPIDTMPKLQLLIDTGVGMPAESLSNLRTGVRNFLTEIPDGVEVTLVSTAPQPRFLERATTDKAKLLAAVDRLAPESGGSGRFVESLYEATQRIDRDKNGRYTVLSLATTAGDLNVRDSDVNDILKRVQQRGTTVHVILVNIGVGRSSGGQIQTDLGSAVTKATGGRFETIATVNRIPTLLSEMGVEIAKTLGGSSRHFRIVVERQSSGNLGALQMSIGGGKILTKLAMEPTGR